MATHSSIFAWEIPWTEDPGGLPSMGSQRVGHDWATNTFSFFCRSFHTALPLSVMYSDGLDLQALGSACHFKKLALLPLFLSPQVMNGGCCKSLFTPFLLTKDRWLLVSWKSSFSYILSTFHCFQGKGVFSPCDWFHVGQKQRWASLSS